MPDALDRIVRLETQMEHERELDVQILVRLDSMDDRLHRLEKYFWMGIGAIMILQFLLQWLFEKVSSK